jgi:hypothetical protein
MFAAEATLLRSQHFGLGRRGSDPQHVTATEEILMVGYSHHWDIFGEPWLRVQRLDGEPPLGALGWAGRVSRELVTPLVVQLSKPSIRSRGLGPFGGRLSIGR